MFNIYKNKKIFVTGASGFKGSWLCNILYILGAEIKGYSLMPDKKNNHFELSEISNNIETEYNDIRNIFGLQKSIESFKPDIVFHLAAQPLVRESYKSPIITYNTNIMGTVNLLDACKNVESIKSIITIVTDKVYDIQEKNIKYKETDRLMGYDPYSASKVCTEIVVDSYRKSFYKDKALLATVRAGNCIGGGDWGYDRIVTDIINSVYEKKEFEIRKPNAIRPWTHVLDILFGYIILGEKLLQGKKEFEGAWNFGSEELISVQEMLNEFSIYFNLNYKINEEEAIKFKETDTLQLDISKAKKLLKWKQKYNFNQIVKMTADWYTCFYEHGEIITEEQIKDYMK